MITDSEAEGMEPLQLDDVSDEERLLDVRVGGASGSSTSITRRRLKVIVAVAIGLPAVFMVARRLQPFVSTSSGDIDTVQSKAQVLMGCHTEVGGSCFDKVKWAKLRGIFENPDDYQGLTPDSTYEEFQAYFHKSNYGNCPMPCENDHSATDAAQRANAMQAAVTNEQAPCLCLFDVDRTLTGKQGASRQCPGNKVVWGVEDNAFGGGELTLSPLGQAVDKTFCSACHLGVISAGGAGGQEEKSVLHAQLAMELGGAPSFWAGPSVNTQMGTDTVHSPLVIGCGNTFKPLCAKGIVDWYGRQGIRIPASEVYFFDDLTGNTAGFADHGFNARQVSCNSREGEIGFCGAEPWEIRKEKGVFNCR